MSPTAMVRDSVALCLANEKLPSPADATRAPRAVSGLALRDSTDIDSRSRLGHTARRWRLKRNATKMSAFHVRTGSALGILGSDGRCGTCGRGRGGAC